MVPLSIFAQWYICLCRVCTVSQIYSAFTIANEIVELYTSTVIRGFDLNAGNEMPLIGRMLEISTWIPTGDWTIVKDGGVNMGVAFNQSVRSSQV